MFWFFCAVFMGCCFSGYGKVSELSVEVKTEGFEKILGKEPKLHLLCKGFGFAEGPVYFSVQGEKAGKLLFKDKVNESVYMIRWEGIEASLYGPPKPLHRPFKVTDPFISKCYENKPVDSLHEAVIKSDDSIWFADSSCEDLSFSQECSSGTNIYRLDPKTDSLSIVTIEIKNPNGMAFSPDEKVLYVLDKEKELRQMYTFEVSQDGKKILGKKHFATLPAGFSDGVRLDVQGNLYVASLEGVYVLNSEGELIGKILLPKQVVNLTFGGEDNDILFICSLDSVWAIKLHTVGCKPISVLTERENNEE